MHRCEPTTLEHKSRKATYDLLDDLAGGVEVDQALVDLELVAVPGLGTLTARLPDTMLRTYAIEYAQK